MKIVIDIDNTLVDYRNSLYQFIKKSNVNLGEIKPEYKMSIIKNKIKESYGDIFWQVVQAYIYSDVSKDVSLYSNSNYFLQKAFKMHNNINNLDFKVSEFQAENLLTLPVHQYLSNKQLNYIINKIKEFYNINQ